MSNHIFLLSRSNHTCFLEQKTLLRVSYVVRYVDPLVSRDYSSESSQLPKYQISRLRSWLLLLARRQKHAMVRSFRKQECAPPATCICVAQSVRAALSKLIFDTCIRTLAYSIAALVDQVGWLPSIHDTGQLVLIPWQRKSLPLRGAPLWFTRYIARGGKYRERSLLCTRSCGIRDCRQIVVVLSVVVWIATT